MKKSFYLLLLVGMVIELSAQVPKKIFVEHFTNTVCSSCGSRNPGFYTNLNNQSNDVLHLSVHSVIPYSQCLLYQQNPVASNARATAHTVSGTPTLIMNGIKIPPATNYAASSLFTPFLNQTSPVSIEIQQQKYGTDSMQVRVTIKTEAAHNLSNQRLWVGVAEDVVNYTGPNGEPQHYDVFRAQLGLTAVTIPANVGDVVVLNYSVAANAVWDFSKIFTFAVLENMSSLSVTQSEAVDASAQNVISSIHQLGQTVLEGVEVFPNPTVDAITIKVANNVTTQASLYTLSGVLLKTENFNQQAALSVEDLSAGAYILKLENEEGIAVQKVIKQ